MVERVNPIRILNMVPHSPDIVFRFAQLAGDDLPRETGSLIGFEGCEASSCPRPSRWEVSSEKEALRRRFPGALWVALAVRFLDGGGDAVESFGGVVAEAGTGASTC